MGLLTLMVTNTVFRDSILENFFLKRDPITSNHWSYHKELLVFCLKFRLFVTN